MRRHCNGIGGPALKRQKPRVVAQKKQTHQTYDTQHEEFRADRVLLQEKRFDVAAPVMRGLFCGEQIQNVTVHKLKCLTAASGDTGQWILSDKGWQTCLIGDALVEISQERATARQNDT